MVDYITLPFKVGENVRLKKIPNYLKNKVTLKDLCSVVGFTIYGTKRGVSILYNLFNVNNRTQFVCHVDFVGEL